MAKKYCINCGNLVPAAAKFCSNCGAPQQGSEAGQFRANVPTIDLGRAALGAEVKEPLSELKTKAAENPAHKKYYEKQHLGKNAVISFFLSYVGKTAILLPFFAVAVAFDPLFAALGFVLYVFGLYLIAYIVYLHFYYWVDEHSFHLTHGIIHKTNVSLSYQQIQNVNINRSLTDRLLGLSRISIETAGNNKESAHNGPLTSTSEGYLPGLSLQEAKEMHDLLLTKADEAN